MTGGFVWPPREPEARPEPEPVEKPQHSGAFARSTTAVQRVSSVGSAVAGLERVWLAPTRMPLGHRVRAMGWSADDVGIACDRCGHAVGAYEEMEFGCAACAGQRLPWTRMVRLGAYEEPLASWVQEVKFERGWRLGEALGGILGGRLVESGFEGVVVPMPTTWRRRMARGTDHALTLARGVHLATGAPIVRALRRSHRPSQRAVNASQRRANVSGVFRSVRRACERIGGRDVVLIDDVMTSGATLRAAARTLNFGLKERAGDGAGGVWCAVLAVTPPASGPGSAVESGSGASEGASAEKSACVVREDGDFLAPSS